MYTFSVSGAIKGKFGIITKTLISKAKLKKIHVKLKVFFNVRLCMSTARSFSEEPFFAFCLTKRTLMVSKTVKKGSTGKKSIFEKRKKLKKIKNKKIWQKFLNFCQNKT